MLLCGGALPSLPGGIDKPGPEELASLFFQDPDFIGMRVSPDGRHIAYMRHYRGKRSLFQYNIAEEKILSGATVQTGEDIDQFHWIDKDTLVYTVSQWNYYYVGAQSFSVGRRSPESIRFLADNDMVLRRVVHPLPQEQGRFVATLERAGRRGPLDLYMVDLNRETFSRITRNTGHIQDWFCDSNGILIGVNEVREGRIYYRAYDAGADTFGEDYEFPVGIIPLELSSNGAFLLVNVRNEKGYLGIGAWDIGKEEMSSAPFHIDGFDINESIIHNNHGHSPIGMRYHAEKPGIVWFDPRMRQIFDAISAAAQNYHLDFVGFGEQLSQLVLGFRGERGGLPRSFTRPPRRRHQRRRLPLSRQGRPENQLIAGQRDEKGPAQRRQPSEVRRAQLGQSRISRRVGLHPLLFGDRSVLERASAPLRDSFNGIGFRCARSGIPDGLHRSPSDTGSSGQFRKDNRGLGDDRSGGIGILRIRPANTVEYRLRVRVHANAGDSILKNHPGVESNRVCTIILSNLKRTTRRRNKPRRIQRVQHCRAPTQRHPRGGEGKRQVAPLQVGEFPVNPRNV